MSRFDIEAFTPTSEPNPTDELTTFGEASDHYTRDGIVECASHHTYVETVALDRFGVWACPACGRFSDAYAPHSGGVHLVAPESVSANDAVVILGAAFVPPSDDSEAHGDGGATSGLILSPYQARDDIKAFREDADRQPGVPWYRRWVPEWGVWAVSNEGLDDFVDHMEDREWIVINLPELFVR